MIKHRKGELLSLLQTAKKKEQLIIDELEKHSIRIYFTINKIVVVKTGEITWEHNIEYFEILPKEKSDKVYEVIRKYYDEWKKEMDKG